MAVRHDSYHTALNLLVVANLFASGLLAGGFVWLWLMLPPAPPPGHRRPPGLPVSVLYRIRTVP